MGRSGSQKKNKKFLIKKKKKDGINAVNAEQAKSILLLQDELVSNDIPHI